MMAMSDAIIQATGETREAEKAAGQVWKGDHAQACEVELLSKDKVIQVWHARQLTNGRLSIAGKFITVTETVDRLIPSEWFANATLVRESSVAPAKIIPAVGQVWKGRHKGACEIELAASYNNCNLDYWIVDQVTDGKLFDACLYTTPAVNKSGKRQRYLLEPQWLESFEYVRDAVPEPEKPNDPISDAWGAYEKHRSEQGVHERKCEECGVISLSGYTDHRPWCNALGARKLGLKPLEAQESQGVFPVKGVCIERDSIPLIDDKTLQSIAAAAEAFARNHRATGHTIRFRRPLCAWCGAVPDEPVRVENELFCCGVHASEYANNPGGSWASEQQRAAKRRSERLTENDNYGNTVTVAGIKMSRKRYKERAAAYAACDHGCAAFGPTSFLADRDLSKPDPEPDQPWSCDDADYVVIG